MHYNGQHIHHTHTSKCYVVYPDQRIHPMTHRIGHLLTSQLTFILPFLFFFSVVVVARLSLPSGTRSHTHTQTGNNNSIICVVVSTCLRTYVYDDDDGHMLYTGCLLIEHCALFSTRTVLF